MFCNGITQPGKKKKIHFCLFRVLCSGFGWDRFNFLGGFNHDIPLIFNPEIKNVGYLLPAQQAVADSADLSV